MAVLPPELFHRVINLYADDARRNLQPSAHLPLILVSRTFRDWTEPYLYRYLNLHSPEQMQQLSGTLNAPPDSSGLRLSSYVTSLLVDTTQYGLTPADFDLSHYFIWANPRRSVFLTLLPSLINLERLCVSTGTLGTLKTEAERITLQAKEVTIILSMNTQPQDRTYQIHMVCRKLRVSLVAGGNRYQMDDEGDWAPNHIFAVLDITFAGVKELAM